MGECFFKVNETLFEVGKQFWLETSLVEGNLLSGVLLSSELIKK